MPAPPPSSSSPPPGGGGGLLPPPPPPALGPTLGPTLGPSAPRGWGAAWRDATDSMSGVPAGDNSVQGAQPVAAVQQGTEGRRVSKEAQHSVFRVMSHRAPGRRSTRTGKPSWIEYFAKDVVGNLTERSLDHRDPVDGATCTFGPRPQQL